MATGSVSAIDRERWQLIQSQAASGTTMTFNSFSGYKHLWLVGKGITKSGSDHTAVRPNNNSTQGNYAQSWNSGQGDKFLVSANASASSAIPFMIFDIDTTGPKHVACNYDAGNPTHEQDSFVDTTEVTSLVVFNIGGSVTFTGGTWYLYGIVA